MRSSIRSGASTAFQAALIVAGLIVTNRLQAQPHASPTAADRDELARVVSIAKLPKISSIYSGHQIPVSLRSKQIWFIGQDPVSGLDSIRGDQPFKTVKFGLVDDDEKEDGNQQEDDEKHKHEDGD